MFEDPAADTAIVRRDARILIRRVPEFIVGTNASTGAVLSILELGERPQARGIDVCVTGGSPPQSSLVQIL